MKERWKTTLEASERQGWVKVVEYTDYVFVSKGKKRAKISKTDGKIRIETYRVVASGNCVFSV